MQRCCCNLRQRTSWEIFEEGKLQLDVKESFYKGEEVSEEQALKLIQNQSREDAIFNLVGKKATQIALKAGIITKEGIGKIQGIPYALVLL